MPPLFNITRVAVVIAAFLLVPLHAHHARAADLTFTRDIAPLVYQHCAACHRPGGAGPFDLLTYDHLRRHLRPALKAVKERVMPPWLPEPGFGDFAGDRRLDDPTIATFLRWVDQGAAEGDPADLPKPPPIAAAGEWSLGKPDLILKLPKSYTLAPEGQDLYRNFVLPPTALDARRFVRAVDLHSGNARVVHHANLFLDRTGAARRRSDKAGGTGYDAMEPGEDVSRPEGSDLNWRPGRATAVVNDASPWLLPADADVVLQTHLRRQGKPETVQPEIGLYFTDKPPTALIARLTLRASTIDIPAGAADHAVENSYTLPVDADALEVFAHAHYLGKDVHGYALLPDGTRRELLRIKRWNFNMQDSYTFKQPVPLPRGTTVHMRWVYDNSDKNPANPSSPPVRVLGGENSTDEMGEFWVQLRLRDRADYDAFNADYAKKWVWPDAVEGVTHHLKRRPDDPDAHVQLAKLMLVAGRVPDAARSLNAAFKLDPKCSQAHYVLASILARHGQYPKAVDRFRRCLEGDPDNFRARADLAYALSLTGKLPEAIEEFTTALRLNPNDPLAHANLARVYAQQGKAAAARTELRQALRLDPDHAAAQSMLKALDAAEKR